MNGCKKGLSLFLVIILSTALDCIDSEKMIPDAQIGQMLIIGFRGTSVDDSSPIARVINDLNIGGVVLYDYDVPSGSFPRNITGPEQLAELTADLKQLSSDLLIAVDAEGGRVNRLKPEYGFAEIPSHAGLGEWDDPDSTFAAAAQLASQLADMGINTNFAPVVDVNINPENPIIAGLQRSFSKNTAHVSAHAQAFIKAHHQYGILTAIKHFPGHGSSAGDTHIGMTDVTDTYSDSELVPYQTLIEDGLVDMIMTSHIINRNFDPEPVTLSDYYIRRILRDSLGFKGVVVSDDMQMGALTEHYSFKEAIIRAVNAGCDVLIFSNNAGVYDKEASYRAVQVIHEALAAGEIRKERIRQAVERVQALKEKLNRGTFSSE